MFCILKVEIDLGTTELISSWKEVHCRKHPRTYTNLWRIKISLMLCYISTDVFPFLHVQLSLLVPLHFLFGSSYVPCLTSTPPTSSLILQYRVFPTMKENLPQVQVVVVVDTNQFKYEEILIIFNC